MPPKSKTTIYVVYETDEHQSYASRCIKLITTDEGFATRTYRKILPTFSQSEWILILAKLEDDPQRQVDSGTDILRNLEPILSSEI